MNPTFVLRGLAALCFVAAAVADWRCRSVPNIVWVPALVFGVAALALEPHQVGDAGIGLMLSAAFVAVTWPRGIGGADGKALLVAAVVAPLGPLMAVVITAGVGPALLAGAAGVEDVPMLVPIAAAVVGGVLVA